MRRGDSVGRYLVLQPVGQGGLGTVYRAYDPDLDRAVALKEVHGLTDGGAGHRATVLREAQAMARLTHPNVVGVYDVIEDANRLFIAMELVEGQDLSRWLAGSPSRDHILRVFIDCARGLAAAHRANLCHGDCKPSNLLVSREGVGKVADFGLAQPARRSVGADANARDRMTVLDAIVPHDVGENDDRVAGTAAYLAPEVRRGDPVDPRSDQYSFGAALYEAVTGRPPTVESAPVDMPRGAPRSLRRLLRRALAAEPAQRFSSMDALADAIAAVRNRRRRLALSVLSAVAGVAVVASVVGPSDPGPCSGLDERWAGVWDRDRRASVAEALESAGVPGARLAAARVADVLDDYTHRWTVAHEQACMASLVHGEQSAELYQARSLCYEHRWEQVRALVEVLQDPDPSLVLPLADPSRALEPLAPCGTEATLLLQVAPLRDASNQHNARQITAELADAAALLWAGRAAASCRIAVQAAADADALGYAPLQAEARLRSGMASMATGAYEDAWADLSSAHFMAEAHRHDRVAASSAIGIVALLSTHLEQPGRAEEWSRQATAAVARLGPSDTEAIDLHNALGTMKQSRGEPGAALEHYQQALTLAEETTTAQRTDIGMILQNLATTLEELGRIDEAETRYTQALAHFERELGAEHPSVAMVLHNMSVLSHSQQRYDEALARARHALALKESALPAPHLSVARTLLVIGPILVALDDPVQAYAVVTRAKQIVQEVVGPEHPQMGIALVNLGEVEQHLGDVEAARGHLTDAIRILGQTYPDDHPLVQQAHAHLRTLAKQHDGSTTQP